jgi:hypothetical protein
MAALRYILAVIAAVVAIGAFGYGTHLLAASMKPELAGAVITAASTVVISIMTLALGRYFEKKRELEALHREKKIPIYGEFLEGVFNVFYGGKLAKKVDATALLQKWQTRIVLWGGADVVNAYLRWKHILTTSEPTAESLRITDELILAIRKELGHDDAGLAKDLFPRFILREYQVLADAAKDNPKVPLSVLAEIEARSQASKAES